MTEFLTTDSAGRKTRSFKLVFVSWLVITLKFTVGGMTLPLIGEQPLFDMYAYGTAALLVLGAWYSREFIKRDAK